MGVAVEGVQIGFGPEHKGEEEVAYLYECYCYYVSLHCFCVPKQVHAWHSAAQIVFEAVPCKKEGVVGKEGHGAGVIYVQQTGDEAEGGEANANVEVDLVKAVRSSFSSLLRICLQVHFYVNNDAI